MNTKTSVFFRIVLLANAFVSARCVAGELVAVEVPPTKNWCTKGTLQLASADQASKVTSFLEELGNRLVDEAKNKKLSSIGLPAVADDTLPEQSDPPSDQSTPANVSVELMVCAAVPEGAPGPSAPVAVVTQSGGYGLATLCIGDPDPCIKLLEAAMQGLPWSLSEEGAAAATHRAHQALSTDDSAQGLVASLTSTQDILISGDSVPVFEGSSTVVAILVPAKPLPTPSASSEKPLP